MIFRPCAVCKANQVDDEADMAPTNEVPRSVLLRTPQLGVAQNHVSSSASFFIVIDKEDRAPTDEVP